MDSNKVYTQDVISESIVEGVLTVTTTPIEVKVGAARLPRRILITIFNNGSQVIYWGTNAVSSVTGLPIFKKQTVFLPISDTVPIYVCTSTGSNMSTLIKEMA